MGSHTTNIKYHRHTRYIIVHTSTWLYYENVEWGQQVTDEFLKILLYFKNKQKCNVWVCAYIGKQ